MVPLTYSAFRLVTGKRTENRVALSHCHLNRLPPTVGLGVSRPLRKSYHVRRRHVQAYPDAHLSVAIGVLVLPIEPRQALCQCHDFGTGGVVHIAKDHGTVPHRVGSYNRFEGHLAARGGYFRSQLCGFGMKLLFGIPLFCLV